MILVKTDLGFLHIIQRFKIVGRETNNNKGNPSCRWSKYFVIVGLPTNNLVVAEGQGISGLEAEFDEH